jgi:hypothetical protein
MMHGFNLKCTFRKCVSPDLFMKWKEVEQIASTVILSDEPDSNVWQYNSNGVFVLVFIQHHLL